MASVFEPNSRGGQGARADWQKPELRDPSPLLLARLIEGEIIPRLLMAHRGDAVVAVVEPRVAPVSSGIKAADVEAFLNLVLHNEVHPLLVHVEKWLARGVPLESVYLDLLAPAARGLGTWWEEDVCDFVDVTMGLWRLQQIVHELAARMPLAAVPGKSRRAFFTVVPGDQHSFGLVLIEEFFRRSGWRTSSAAAPTAAELVGTVRQQWFDVIGFTVTCEDQVEHLPAIIEAVRQASRNPRVGVMVGGRVFTDQPELAARVGADATAADGKQAVAKAEMLVELLTDGIAAVASGRD